MKMILSTLLIGLVILYFIDSAIKVEILDLEMLTHNLVRFFAGFVFLGIWVWYKHQLKLKIAAYFILALLISDDISDYIRNIDNLTFEMVFHDSFVILWGTLTGFFYMKRIKIPN